MTGAFFHPISLPKYCYCVTQHTATTPNREIRDYRDGGHYRKYFSLPIFSFFFRRASWDGDGGVFRTLIDLCHFNTKHREPYNVLAFVIFPSFFLKKRKMKSAFHMNFVASLYILLFLILPFSNFFSYSYALISSALLPFSSHFLLNSIYFLYLFTSETRYSISFLLS